MEKREALIRFDAAHGIGLVSHEFTDSGLKRDLMNTNIVAVILELDSSERKEILQQFNVRECNGGFLHLRADATMVSSDAFDLMVKAVGIFCGTEPMVPQHEVV